MGTPQELRQRVLGLQRDRKLVPLDVPGWGDDLYIRVLTAREQSELSDGVTPARMPILVILHCIVNAEGERVFDDDDEGALGEFPFPEIMDAFAQVGRVNGLTTKELEDAVAVFRSAPDEQRSTA